LLEDGRQLGDARDTAANIALATDALGYVPVWNVADGIREQAGWHEDRRRQPQALGTEAAPRPSAGTPSA
jgi:nucleoside-diphosphate-sugar epimerase